MKFVFGLTGRAGVVAGNTGPFFFSQEFALGGVQYGEQLRGYDEFSISPYGYITNTDNFNATRFSFGKAFFTATAELGFRVNQSLYTNLFYDAGNVYATARQFDPTRLFRGAGIGVSTITPLGPLGLDWATASIARQEWPSGPEVDSYISDLVSCSNLELFMNLNRRATKLALVITAATAAPAFAQGGAPATPKIAYVDSKVILARAPGRQAAEDTFNKEIEASRAQVQKMGDSLQTMIADYQKDQATLAANVREQRESAIRKKQEDYQTRAGSLDQQMQRARSSSSGRSWIRSERCSTRSARRMAMRSSSTSARRRASSSRPTGTSTSPRR